MACVRDENVDRPVGSVIYQLLGGLRASMGYTGCATLEALRTDAQFIRRQHSRV